MKWGKKKSFSFQNLEMFLNPKCLSCWKCSVEKCFYMRKVTAKVREDYFLLPSYKTVIPIPATSA